MSLLTRLRNGYRGLIQGIGGSSDLRHSSWWLDQALVGQRTTAGVAVTPSTALTVGAYFRAIALVSASVAKMPVRVVRVNDKRREPIDGHAIARLLNRRPNSENTAWDFKETMTQWAMGHGNAIAVIDRDRNGLPIALWPRPPGELRLVVDDKLPLGDPMRVLYEWNNSPGSGRTSFLMADDVLHIKGMGTGLWGYSVAQQAARDIGQAIAQGEHGGAFFGNAARPGGILSFPNALKPEARENVRRSFEALYAGSGNSYKTLLMEEGASWSPLTMPMEDAQFLEQNKFGVTVMARWFGVPPHKLGDLEHATFSNIEHQSIEYVTDAVLPWATRWEHESCRKLLGVRSGNQEIDFDETVLIRGDSVQRAERTRTLISTAVMTPDEGRVEMGLNPTGNKGADELYIQGAMATLETIADPPEPPPPVLPPMPPEAGEEGDDPPTPPEPPEANAVAALFTRSAARIVRRETKAVSHVAKRERLDFIAWANDWYAGHRDFLSDEFRPLLSLYDCPDWDGLTTYLSDWQRASIQTAADRHQDGSLVEWMESYEPERASELASTLLAIARGTQNVEA